MSLSTSRLKLRFLSDENVDKRLTEFLKQEGVDIISKPKGLSNGKLAAFSKAEQRVLVTNDEDFAEYPKEEIFSVVWLRIPQRKIEVAKDAFSKLLKSKTSPHDFEGSIVTLHEDRLKSDPLFQEIKLSQLNKLMDVSETTDSTKLIREMRDRKHNK